MSLFITKFCLIIALSLIDKIYPNYINIKKEKKYFNSSFIINVCKFENYSPLILFNFSNNFEFMHYSDISNENISKFFENYKKNVNFEKFNIPNLKTSKNFNKFNFSLLSGNTLLVSFKNFSNNKYTIDYSIYKYFPSLKICLNKQKMDNNFITNFFISCLEYVLNEIFCIYIEDQNPHGYLTKLKINHFFFNGLNLELKSDEFLQAFNYKIKNFQLIKISLNIIILIIYKVNNKIEVYLLNNLLKENKYLEKCRNLKEEIKLNLTERRKAFKIYENEHKVYIEGHRGGFSRYGENTLYSFKEAIKKQIDSIEIDIWLTKDNIPIVFHRDKIKSIPFIRYKGDKFIGEISINNITLDFIKKVNKNNKRKEIPTLEEVLDLCKNSIFINIELKDYQCERTFDVVIKLIESKNMFDQVSISSYRVKYIQLINEFNKKNKKKIECGYIFNPISKIKNITKAKGCSANVPSNQINKKLIQEAHKNGIPVMAYFLKWNEENDKIYENLINYGIDVICCNYPYKALKFRNKYYVSKYNISKYLNSR